MNGTPSQMAARERTLDLLCEGEQQRLAGVVPAGQSRVRRALEGLLDRLRSA